ncbi:hypothetical protein KEM52_000177 [Ascosphaera acerosa]|nr:hypothetical protein KEM52_000177 [Ascosphaera acerosa]
MFMMREPLDLSHHFSATAKRLQPSDVKRFYRYFTIPGIRNLAGGMPHAGFFPFETLEASIAAPASDIGSRDRRISVPHADPKADAAEQIDVTTALQYGTAQGYPALTSFVRAFTREHLHPSVPYAGGPEVVMTCGNTDGFSKVVQLLTDAWEPGRGDRPEDRQFMLCEEHTYMNAVQTVQPRGLNVVPVRMDGHGLVVEGEGGLKQVLDQWDERRGKRPRLLYTIPSGQNPTGTVMPLSRKREIYAVCQAFDIIICEDEPYWHLQFGRGTAVAATDRAPPTAPFLRELVPSFLSLNVDGRVIRLDTFSKTIAPGFSKARIYEFQRPGGGMFVWMQVFCETHPLAASVGEERLLAALCVFLTEEPFLALVAPGSMFNPLAHSGTAAQKPAGSSTTGHFLRLSFAAVQEEDVASASQGVVDGIHAFWGITEVQEIDKLLGDGRK